MEVFCFCFFKFMDCYTIHKFKKYYPINDELLNLTGQHNEDPKSCLPVCIFENHSFLIS